MANNSEYGTRLFSDAELLALPWLVVGYKHYRNPFAHVVNTPIGDENAYRWCFVHGEFRDKDAAPLDPFEDLFFDTKAGPPPMNELGGGKEGFGTAVFPNVPALPTMADQDAWEERSRIMHEAQTRIDPDTMPEKTDDKPFERPMFHRTMNEEKAPPQKFEDLPEKVRHGLHRAD